MQNQRILVHNNEGEAEPIQVLEDDSRPLGYYNVLDNQVLKVRFILLFDPLSRFTLLQQVIDTNPSTSFTGQLSDVSQVEKFELTEEEYARRQGELTH